MNVSHYVALGQKGIQKTTPKSPTATTKTVEGTFSIQIICI
jgi:hypothetical protein